MNKLRNMRCYLGGAMEFAPGCGVDWRQKIQKMDRGIIWLDPCNKPIDIGIEDVANHERWKQLKRDGEYDIVAKEMRIIRCVDLRMVDISDFLIFNIDIDIHTCGTYEEITTANRQKKPIIVRIKQGKENTPGWLLGTIPHQMIFSTFQEVEDYLKGIDSGADKRDFKRWFFFNFKNHLILEEKRFEKEVTLDNKSLDNKEESLKSWTKSLEVWRESLETLKVTLGKEEETLKDKEKSLNKRESLERKSLEMILDSLRNKEATLGVKEKTLGVKERVLNNKEKTLKSDKKSFASLEKSFAFDKKTLLEKEKRLEVWGERLNDKEDALRKSCQETGIASLKKRLKETKDWEKHLDEMERY